LLPVRQFDQRIRLTRANACALDDPRDPDLTEHTFLEMVRSRVYRILAGYEEANPTYWTSRSGPLGGLVRTEMLIVRNAMGARLVSKLTMELAR
jgi:hypothetical protein